MASARRLELCPEKRFLNYPHLPKAVGSHALGERVAALRPDGTQHETGLPSVGLD
jgi:hypothetical protein